MRTEAGVDVNGKLMTHVGLTPLMMTAGNSAVAVVKLLRAWGADSRAKDHNNWTVLLWHRKKNIQTGWNRSNKPDMSDRWLGWLLQGGNGCDRPARNGASRI